MIGGKWTTFRAFAEQVTDRLLSDLGRPRISTSKERPTQGEPSPDLHSDPALRALLRNEAVVHLDDLLLRRTPIALYERLTVARFTALALLAAEELGWDDVRLGQEHTRTLHILAERHGVGLQPISSHV